jgi:hypothetical protein
MYGRATLFTALAANLHQILPCWSARPTEKKHVKAEQKFFSLRKQQIIETKMVAHYT